MITLLLGFLETLMMGFLETLMMGFFETLMTALFLGFSETFMLQVRHPHMALPLKCVQPRAHLL